MNTRLWTVPETLAGIIDYINSVGIDEDLITARLFQIAMASGNDGNSIRAIEMLSNRGFRRKEDIGDLTIEQLRLIADLEESILGATNDDLRTILGDIAFGLPARDETDYQTDSIAIIPSVHPSHDAGLPLRHTQSFDGRRAESGGDGIYQESNNRGSSSPYKDAAE
jgi:hypothetical protein